ncbi:MAG: hypothetical protein IPF47_02175 [Gemmatimonadetes bacterium]|nr:hypothetical protein [Gemmatimonadota bacterium]
MAGQSVWKGRLPGAMRLGCDGSSEYSAPRLCSTIPVPGTMRPLPKAAKSDWIIDTALPSLSTTVR